MSENKFVYRQDDLLIIVQNKKTGNTVSVSGVSL